ncbi:MAG: hypothetical protein QGG40_14830, partial [Myxococcota bacterium]|nr:hypothetical protein [Myxococcota bacterium]
MMLALVHLRAVLAVLLQPRRVALHGGVCLGLGVVAWAAMGAEGLGAWLFIGILVMGLATWRNLLFTGNRSPHSLPLPLPQWLSVGLETSLLAVLSVLAACSLASAFWIGLVHPISLYGEALNVGDDSIAEVSIQLMLGNLFNSLLVPLSRHLLGYASDMVLVTLVGALGASLLVRYRGRSAAPGLSPLLLIPPALLALAVLGMGLGLPELLVEGVALLGLVSLFVALFIAALGPLRRLHGWSQARAETGMGVRTGLDPRRQLALDLVLGLRRGVVAVVGSGLVG